ncbi:MAG TPA: DUF2079 domain-containing protein [Trebonia sp.]
MTVENATLAPVPEAGTRTRRRLPRHFLPVAILTLAMAALYAVFSLTLQHTTQTSSYDLVIFDEAIRSYAHLQPGIAIIKGDHNGFGPNFSELGDHFSPMIALLAPFYWIYNGPQTLLVAQAVLFALALPPLWVYTRRALGGGRKAVIAAYLVAIAYALSWPIVNAAAFDFHEAAFAPVLTALIFERFQAGKLKTALLACFGLLLVKEDMGFYVAGVGIFLLFQDIILRKSTVNRQKLIGVGLIVGGFIAVVVSVYILIPAAGGKSSYYWAYTELGPNGPAAATYMATHPLTTAHILVSPSEKAHTYLWLFAPFLFLSLLSPAVIPVLPLLLERMLGVKYPDWWGLPYHYNSYLVITLAIAAVDGAARVDRWVRKIKMKELKLGDRLAAGWIPVIATGLMAVIAIAVVPRFPLDQMLHPSFYKRTAADNAAIAAANAVPSGVTVEAMSNIGPQLTGRDTVLLWDGDGTTSKYEPEPPWVVCSPTIRTFSFLGSIAEQASAVKKLQSRGYVTVFDQNGYLVMHAPGVKYDAKR